MAIPSACDALPLGCSVLSVFKNYSHTKAFTVVIFIWTPLEVAASKSLRPQRSYGFCVALRVCATDGLCDSTLQMYLDEFCFFNRFGSSCRDPKYTSDGIRGQ